MPHSRATRKGKAKVFLVDDHPIVRQGLTQMINHEADLVVCGEAEDARGALKAIAETAPDVVVVDLNLKNSNGLDLIKDIKVRQPHLPMLVLSFYNEGIYAERALRAGAHGYMMKEEATDKVLTALRRILAGEIYLSEAMASRLLHRFANGSKRAGGAPEDLLSDRELEVFQFIGQGLGTAQIAHKLHLSPKTIETYRAHIKDKLNLHDAGELLQYAIQWAQRLSGPA